MTNSASSLTLASSLSSRPSFERHVRHIVSVSSAETSVTVASRCGLFPHASSPVPVDAWVAPYRPLLARTTLTKPAFWPLGKSMSSTTFHAMRLWTCARLGWALGLCVMTPST
jgi:hypothetical protein